MRSARAVSPRRVAKSREMPDDVDAAEEEEEEEEEECLLLLLLFIPWANDAMAEVTGTGAFRDLNPFCAASLSAMLRLLLSAESDIPAPAAEDREARAELAEEVVDERLLEAVRVGALFPLTAAEDEEVEEEEDVSIEATPNRSAKEPLALRWGGVEEEDDDNGIEEEEDTEEEGGEMDED